MIHNNKISLIIPCKNEEAALFSMLSNMPSYVDEVIVVDNNSTDNTAKVAKFFGAKVLLEDRHIGGVGYGYAHQRGMKEAKGDIIIAMDGDNTYPLDAISEIVAYMDRSHADFVSCARFPLSNPHAISPLRQFGVWVLNTQVALLYGYRVKDILSGMWAMKKDCVKKLNATDGEWNFSPEIKLAAIKNPDIHFTEFHISHAVRLNGMSKQNLFKTGFNHLFYILKRRLTVDRFSGKEQVQFIVNHVGYSFKALL